MLFTLISACVITVSLACSNGDPWGWHPSTGAARRSLPDLCAGRCPPWAWELLCALGQLFRAALGTMIMVLWNEVLSRTVTSSLREEPIIPLSQLRDLNASYAELCAMRPNNTCGVQSSSDLIASAESFKRIQVVRARARARARVGVGVGFGAGVGFRVRVAVGGRVRRPLVTTPHALCTCM